MNIKPFTALILFAIFSAVLGGKFWAYGAAASVRMFSHMQAYPNGNGYIMLGNQLFGFDRQGLPTEKIDLAHFGIDKDAVTDFAFFSNGDLLIRRHIDPHDFIFNLQQYFRFDNLQNPFSNHADSGLFRCETTSFRCLPFTTPNLNLSGAYWLAIDWGTDQVFISDTSRHTLYLYSNTGARLDSVGGFRYPNQIRYQDRKIHVSDTNHHRLVTMGINDGRFGAILDTMYTWTSQAIANGEIWPAAFLLMDGRIWVHNANDNMAYGGIYIFERGGSVSKRVALPGDADPLSLLQMGQTVLVSDFSQGRIYQLDADGKLLPEFQPEVFQLPLRELNEEKKLYHSLELLFTGLFALGLASGFGFAIYQQRRGTSSNDAKRQPANEKITLDDANIYWIKPKFTFKLLMAILGFSNVILLPMIEFFWFFTGTSFSGFFKNSYGILVPALFLGLMALMQLRRKIGIADGFVAIVPAWGTARICAQEDILYSDVFILFGKAVIPVNNLTAVFPSEDIEQRLYPMIKRGRPVEMTEVRTVLWNQKQVVALWLVIITALIGSFLYFGFRNP